MPTVIRPALASDAAAIARIVATEVLEGVAHFGSRAPTAHTQALEIARSAPHPFLVAEVDDRVVGFARSGPWKSRAAYRWTAEVSVYVHPEFVGRGIGRLLMTALVARLEELGVRTLLAGVTLPNPASVALFESLGFRQAGVIEQTGFKADAWHSVGYWQRHLGEGAPQPVPQPAPRFLPIVQVDAFAERPFEGNPAAVMRLPQWLDDATLAAIANENNLSETAFVVDEPDGLRLRWFTPTVEVDLCGHATLAAGFVVLNEDGGDQVDFQTRSGPLSVRRDGEHLAMDLPALPPERRGLPVAVSKALGTPPVDGWALPRVHQADYWLALYDDAEAVRDLVPDIGALRALDTNVICTAPGRDALDFVSRFFAPGSGVDEDPVTGSAHASLTPFWVARLGRNPLRARQISARGGSLECELKGDRVILRARCVEVIRGTLQLR